ncbi:MAG: thiamine pyrophosphate-binding protein [Gemmataceae bacterium]|nr:thiamine pyrophosphate-binding protein [Gemmataceae bacterium]
MDPSLSRRDVLKAAGATATAAAVAALPPAALDARHTLHGHVKGLMTGARAVVETLQAEGTLCVFGIPGAQGNELWDQMKTRHLPYLLVTNEFSASIMADAVARATGRPGVLAVVPGPGVTNALTGLGEALLDSVPVVAIVGDVARGKKHRPFQVHEIPNAALLRPACKAVLEADSVAKLPCLIRHAFRLSLEGEPGPVAVVVPYNLLIETAMVDSAPLPPRAVPFDECAFRRALGVLSDKRLRVGLHVGLGCMDYGNLVARAAEALQAPISSSVSGKGVVSDAHPLAVGWGYGPFGTRTAEQAFKEVDCVLAVGVRFSEVGSGFYSIPQKKHLIHVDSCADNLGKAVPAGVCVHADAGVFLTKLLENEGAIARPACKGLTERIARHRAAELKIHQVVHARCGVDPVAFLLALRRALCEDAITLTDVTMVEHLAAEAFPVLGARTYMNPVDNQAMGWSIPAAIGVQRVMPSRQVVTVTGDGCMLMSAMELSTAAREGLPVKFFILDDGAYSYMQVLQQGAYKRTTATILPRLDYPSLAKGLGLAHVELACMDDLEARLRDILALPGPVLTTVKVEHGKRVSRWIEAVKGKYTRELAPGQKARFLARLGTRSLALRPQND